MNENNRIYFLKDTTPYSKLKQNNVVFELQTTADFERVILDNDGEVFIEDTKAYLLTKNNRCFVLFYTDKTEIENILNERMKGVKKNDGNNVIYHK